MNRLKAKNRGIAGNTEGIRGLDSVTVMKIKMKINLKKYEEMDN